MAGYNSYGTYKNCSTDITINGHGCSGGFIGSDFSGSYENCTAKGNVSGQWSVGGFAGILFWESKAKNCIADVKVTANNWNAGGFVGYDKGGTVTSCSYDAKKNPELKGVGQTETAGTNSILPQDNILSIICTAYYGDHDWDESKEIIKEKPTDVKEGSKGYLCKRCGDYKEIAKIKPILPSHKADITDLKVNLSETEYTYNGKVKQPAVIIKDQNGNVISSTNYAVTYASGRKKPGTYSVQITMKGNYTGTQTVLFNIRGKKMPAPKLKAHSRALKVTWKKQKAITGYQIQYSTNAKFKKSKTKIVKIAKGRQTSKFIKKLKARKKYYVRVRSYKTTKIGGKTYNAYSVWSKTKKVIVKK